MANYSSEFLFIHPKSPKLSTDYHNLTKYVSVVLFFITLLLMLSRVLSNERVPSKNRKKYPSKLAKRGLVFPFRFPVIDTLYFVYKVRRDGLHFVEELAKRWGNLFEVPFIPVNLTVVADPVVIQKILSSTDPLHLNRPKLYRSIFEDSFHDGLLTSEYELWFHQRKMLSRCFTYKSLQNYLAFMNKHAQKLTASLLLQCTENDTVEENCINKLLYCYAFKTISQIVMGTDSLSPEENELVSNNANRFKDLMVERLMDPLSYKHYFWLHPKKREYDYLSKFSNKFIADMKDMYKRQAEEFKILGKMRVNEESTYENNDESVGVIPFRCMIEEMLCCGAGDKEICDQVGTFLGTGHETTVVAIRMLLLHLALNPDHQIKCREEIDLFYTMQANNEAYMTMDDIQNLKYLERCIMESGRITSTVPLFLRRLDAPLKINDDIEFPANTTISICSWLLHRDPEIFPEPLKFDPDRFLAENVKKRHPYSYIPFSLGPKLCIGYKVAIMQVKITMAQILRHFEIFSDEKLENVKFLLGLTIVPERDFKIALKRRVH